MPVDRAVALLTFGVMGEQDKKRPGESAAGRQRAEERAARRAAALRANLKKRKAQQRGRAESEPPRNEDG